MEVDRARKANFAQEKPDICAFDFTEAVAPVKMRVPGYFAEPSSECFSSNGRLFCEKIKAPLLFGSVSIVSVVESKTGSRRKNVPAHIIACGEIVDFHFQQRASNESSRCIEDCSSTRSTLVLLLNLVESRHDTFFARDVCANTNSFPAALVDFFDKVVEIIRVPREQSDWVGFGELTRARCTSSWSDAGYDCKGFGCHCELLELV